MWRRRRLRKLEKGQRSLHLSPGTVLQARSTAIYGYSPVENCAKNVGERATMSSTEVRHADDITLFPN
jgi:hypothetical protein